MVLQCHSPCGEFESLEELEKRVLRRLLAARLKGVDHALSYAAGRQPVARSVRILLALLVIPVRQTLPILVVRFPVEIQLASFSHRGVRAPRVVLTAVLVGDEVVAAGEGPRRGRRGRAAFVVVLPCPKYLVGVVALRVSPLLLILLLILILIFFFLWLSFAFAPDGDGIGKEAGRTVPRVREHSHNAALARSSPLSGPGELLFRFEQRMSMCFFVVRRSNVRLFGVRLFVLLGF